MEYLGIFAFIFAIGALVKVRRLERQLRENDITSRAGRGLARQLEQYRGQVIGIDIEDGGFIGDVRVLDVDEAWVLLRVNEGKKSQRDALYRLDNVEQIKVK